MTLTIPPGGASIPLPAVAGFTPVLIAPAGAVAQPLTITASTSAVAPAGFPSALVSQLNLSIPIAYIALSGPPVAFQQRLHVQIPSAALPGSAALYAITVPDAGATGSSSRRSASLRKPSDVFATTSVPTVQLAEHGSITYDLYVETATSTGGSTQSSLSGVMAVVPAASPPGQNGGCSALPYLTACLGGSQYDPVSGTNRLPFTVTFPPPVGQYYVQYSFPNVYSYELIKGTDCGPPVGLTLAASASGQIPIARGTHDPPLCILYGQFDVNEPQSDFVANFELDFDPTRYLPIALYQPASTASGSAVTSQTFGPLKAVIQEQINGSSSFLFPVDSALQGPLSISTTGQSPTCDASSFFFSADRNGSVIPLTNIVTPGDMLIATNTSSIQLASAGCRLIFSDGTNTEAVPFLFNPFTAATNGFPPVPDPTLQVSGANGVSVTFTENANVYTSADLPAPTGLYAPPQHPLYYANAGFLLATRQLTVPDCRDVIDVHVLPPVPGVSTTVTLQSEGAIAQPSLCALYLQDDVLNQPFVLPVTLAP